MGFQKWLWWEKSAKFNAKFNAKCLDIFTFQRSKPNQTKDYVVSRN